MKKYLYILLLIVNNDVLYSQSFYPIQKTNVWNYSSVNSRKHLTVIADSIFPNGKSYAILSEPDLVYGQYVRADSQYVYYYDPIENKEIPFFLLNGKVGDFTEVRYRDYFKVHVTKIDSAIVFNTKVQLIDYLLESMTITKITLSDKFGPISASFYDDPPAPWPQFTYNIIGCKINEIKYGEPVSVKQLDEIPSVTKLFQNYPNPFNPITKIQYTIARADFVSLKVYDILGKEIASLVNNYKNAGGYEVKFNAYGLSSGIYYYKLNSGGNRVVKKMLLLK